MNYIDKLLLKITSWVMGEVYAQSVYGPPEYFQRENDLPIPKYEITPTTYDLNCILWYFAGGLLIMTAIGVVIWYKFRKKKK